MTENTSQLLPLFLYTMQDYERITKHVIVSEGLKRFDFTSATTADALAAFVLDSVAIDVRLMLQRKYFQRKEGLHWEKLLKAARDSNAFRDDALDDISNRMNSTHSQPIELALSDGATISEQFKNAEDVIYGSLLHGEAETNNVKLDTWVPGRCEYAFADVPEHRADALFIRSEVPVRFRRKEMGKDDVGFVIVFCHFKKQYEERFLECMADLERVMVMEGHAGYREFCDSLLGPIIGRNTC